MNYRKSLADLLLDIKAVKLQPNDPFTWASGWKSPIYCDNRKNLSNTRNREAIVQRFVEHIIHGYRPVEVVCGVATAGIPWAALVAAELDIPMIYARKDPKDHGTKGKIEGDLEPGQRVLVIEDLISTGGSSLAIVDTVREAGGNVIGLGAIFSYQFEKAETAFRDADCKFFTLTDYENLIEQALEINYITEADVELLKSWRLSPSTWGK